MSNNKLSGEIPDLRNLTSLQYVITNISAHSAHMSQLFLTGNLFEGELPNLSNSTELYQVSLGNNRFSGNIPPWTNLSSLYMLQLSSNFLTGHVSCRWRISF